MAVSDGFVVVYFIGESLYNMPIFRHLHIFGHMHQYILVTFSVHISPNKKGAPYGKLTLRTRAIDCKYHVV